MFCSYFLAPSFRTIEKADNLVGGSCNNTTTSGGYFLKLKIYTCTSQDVEEGRCNLCSNEGCLYKCKVFDFIESCTVSGFSNIIYSCLNLKSELMIPSKKKFLVWYGRFKFTDSTRILICVFTAIQ